MNRRLFGLLAAALAVGVAACVSDPTDELSGAPDRIVTSLSRIVLPLGDSILVTAELVDEQGATIPERPSEITTAGGVASVTDVSRTPLPVTSFFVKGVAQGPGTVTVAAGSVSTDITVLVLPPFFDGSASIVSTANLDTITVTAGTLIGFDSTASNVLVDGVGIRLISRSATEIKGLVRASAASAAAVVTLEDVLFLPGTENELSVDAIDLEAGVAVAGEDNEPDNADPATGTALALNTDIEGLVSTSDVDDFFVITLAAPATLEIITSFDGGGGDPDIDVFLLNAAGGGFCVLDGCDMATGANPETTTTGVIPAGTYTVYINLYDIGDAEEPAWYRLRVNIVP